MLIMIHHVNPVKGLLRSVFYKLKFQSHTAVRTVVESPKLLGGDVVLDVTRIPMISDVEDCKAGPPFVPLAAKRNTQTFRDEQVERQQPRKASTLITWAN